jgi:serine/threonine-protein kinase RsbW
MAAATSIKLVIPSEVRLVDLVHEVSQKLAELAGFSPDDALNVGLAVREAVINAILHGNKSDPSREVEIRLDIPESGGIRVQIRDQGDGFDPEATPDPTEDENVLNASGRGILMIRAFVDSVTFRFRKGSGMEITLVKNKVQESGAA